MSKMQSIITVGGIKGRHDLPVSRYLIDDAVTNFASASTQAFDAMTELLRGTPRDAVIRFYPTGLSTVSFGAIAAFVDFAGDDDFSGDHTSNRTLEIWEYDRDKDDYICTTTFEHYAQPADSSVHAYGTVKGGVLIEAALD